MGTWEWLIVVLFAVAVAWRFWPESWRFMPRARLSVRSLMVAVLVAGLICGGFARWYTRQAQRRTVIGLLHVQQQVTNSVIHEARADVAAGRKAVSFLTQDAFGPDTWTERLDAHEDTNGQRMPLIDVEVSGGCEEGHLRPITIKASGASMERPFLDRLIAAYRARGWRHRVVPRLAADP